MSVSVVVPAKNAASFIAETMRSVLANESVKQLIVVDDGSTDETANLIRTIARHDPRVALVQLDVGRGAGAARNVGLALATQAFTMFLDADDFLAPNAIDEIHGMIAGTRADLAVYAYRFCTRTPADAAGMHPSDARFWTSLPNNATAFLTSFDKASAILSTVNFPWNKICRTDYLRRIGLRFSDTFVHNDILGHWMSYLNAGEIVLYNKPLIFHRQDVSRGTQLTHIVDRRRLDVFQAFADVEDYFQRQPRHLAYYPFFLAFKLEVLAWISQIIAAELTPEFYAAVERSYAHFDGERQAQVRMIMPEVARVSLNAKENAAAIFQRAA